ncbi:hypothetical protein IEO21_10775 [Rhodonia placenta]|uniref:Uncharacterized protein n=1 Tax=Rhodonia placenta TaxID=104341 RepID=A0A8H7NRW5_9APHY|nr:hypothetical protein IEO21_10775 [Postia placenta]
MLGPSDGLVMLVILIDRSRRAVWTRLRFTSKYEGGGAFSQVDVEEVL